MTNAQFRAAIDWLRTEAGFEPGAEMRVTLLLSSGKRIEEVVFSGAVNCERSRDPDLPVFYYADGKPLIVAAQNIEAVQL